MNETYKLEIPRFISAVLAAKPPGEQFPRRGWWFVGEKAGERIAVNRIPTRQERRALLVCLMPGVSVVTAQEVREMFDAKESNDKINDKILKHFYDTLQRLGTLKIARVEGEELGEPMRIFSHIRKTWGRVEWAFTSDYLRWCARPHTTQKIKYPVKGLAADLKKFPMASMVMLAAAEWYSMNKKKTNWCFISVKSALTYWPYDLKRIAGKSRLKRDIKEPLKRTLKFLGLDAPKEKWSWRDYSAGTIDMQSMFPKPKKSEPENKKKEEKKPKEGDIQSDQFGKKPDQFGKKPDQFGILEQFHALKQGV